MQGKRGVLAAAVGVTALGIAAAKARSATARHAVRADVPAPLASAAGWLPHGANDSWTYQWSDAQYQPQPTIEKVTVKDGADAKDFTLAWTTSGESSPSGLDSTGTTSFQDTTGGIENTDWSSTPPPPDFPILCAQISGCGNSVTSTLYMLIWGGRSPVLQLPLRSGDSWSSTGGAQGDVTSTSTYDGSEEVTVPAFPQPVEAAKIRTDITQAGARGDPYGSGVRTTWWVYGVGPVKIDFQHTGGDDQTAELENTTLIPQPAPSDISWFPLTAGKTLRYQWTNTKYLPKPEIEKFTVDQSANDVARFTLTHASGPIRIAGSYIFVNRLDGLTNTQAYTQAATLAKLPPLGPASLPPNQRRRFFTPFDLLTYGFNPILDAYPKPGDSWGSIIPSRDYSVFGVTGSTRIIGTTAVTVPAGHYEDTLETVSTLTQRGFPFGSGTRICWFAPNVGLVKLIFRHADHSVSTVELLK